VTVIAPENILDKYKNFSFGAKPGSFLPVSAYFEFFKAKVPNLLFNFWFGMKR